MGDVVFGDKLRLALEFEMPEEQKAMNILGLSMTSGTATDAQFLTAAATFITTCYATLQGVIHNQVDINDGIINTVVWSGTAWVVDRLIGTILPTFSPTDAADMLPHACAAVVTMPTILPKKRGRIFLPGFSEVQQSDSLWVAGAATAMANFATAIRAGFTAGTGLVQYVVLGKAGGSNGTTGFDVGGVVGSQRRRKPGIGM